MISNKPTLDYAELGTLLYRICNVVNDRPVHLRNSNEDTMIPLTVNQLLLGKTITAKPITEPVIHPEAYSASESYLQELTKCW